MGFNSGFKGLIIIQLLEQAKRCFCSWMPSNTTTALPLRFPFLNMSSVLCEYYSDTDL